jgi:tetratricopeptide (TPR) repeat protein
MRPTIGGVALIAVLILGPFEHGASGQGVIGSGLDGFQAWLDLARRHVPGRLDDAIVQEREIPLEQHFALAVDLEALIQFIQNPNRGTLRKAGRPYSEAEQALLKRLAAIERQAGTTDKLLRQIALLESDGVMVAGGRKFIIAPLFSKVPKDMLLSHDGIGLDVVVTPPNWRIARIALDAMSADPAARRWIHQWYNATTAYLFYDHVLAVIPDHVAGWQRILPDDGEAWFQEGCALEVFAGSRIQQARLDARRKGREALLETSYSHLRQARRRFEEALVRNPRHVEARLRLARVKSLLGETQAAIKELTAVLPNLGSDSELLYLGQLFLGAAQESSGDYAGAKAAFSEAANLYPRALSPRISRAGLQTPSADAVDDTVADLLRQERIRSDDPWLSYHLGPGRFGPNLVTALWAVSRAQ